MYSQVVWQHIRDPQHRGQLEGANGLGEGRYPKCGDHFILQLRIEDQVIQEACFLAKACAPVVAMGSVGCELVRGLSLEQALQVSAFQLDKALGGLPPPKRHAILLFLESLYQAIHSYKPKNEKGLCYEKQSNKEIPIDATP